MGTVLGCGSDTTGPALTSPSHLFWALHINAPAVTLALTAPYDTAQLVATPLTATGDTLTSAEPVTYTAVDSTVTVSPAGLVTAKYVTGQTQVIAALTVQGTTLTDTVAIMVTPTRQFTLATLSIQPPLGGSGLDSAKLAFDKFNKRLQVYATDSVGNALCTNTGGCPFPIALTSSNPEVATLDNATRIISQVNIGHTTFTVTARVYGVSRTDTLPFTIGYVLNGSIDLSAWSGNILHVAPLTIGVGGRVFFTTSLPQPVEVVLPYTTPQIVNVNKDATQLTDTIPASEASSVMFKFDSAGTYTAHLRVLGSGGAAGATVDATFTVSGGP